MCVCVFGVAWGLCVFLGETLAKVLVIKYQHTFLEETFNNIEENTADCL